MCTQMIEEDVTETGLCQDVELDDDDCAASGLHEEVDEEEDSAETGEHAELAD